MTMRLTAYLLSAATIAIVRNLYSCAGATLLGGLEVAVIPAQAGSGF